MADAANGQVVLNPAAGLASGGQPDGLQAADSIPDYGAQGPRRRMVRRKTIAPDVGFTTFSTAMKAGWPAELNSRKFKQAVLAELVATAIFVAVGSASVIFTNDIATMDATFVPNGQTVSASGALPVGSGATPATVIINGQTFTYGYISSAGFPLPRITGISFVFGLMISILVFATGTISGGNLNPAVTLSLALTGKMSGLRATCYVLAQCLGATMGSAFIYSLAPDLFDAAGGAANGVAWGPSVSTWTVLGAEMTGTALLLTTVSAAADVGREKNTKYQGALTPLIIGLAVLVAHLFLIPIDGCSINPARSFGSAVVARNFKDHWVFWVGPLLGGPFAAILYEYVFKLPRVATTPGPVIVEAADPASLVLVEGKDGISPAAITAASTSAEGQGPWAAPAPAPSGPPPPDNPFDAPEQQTAALNARSARILAMQSQAAQPQPVPVPIPVQRVAQLPVPGAMADAYSLAKNLA